LENWEMLSKANVMRFLVIDGLGALAVGLIVGFFTRDYAYSIATGLSMVYMVELFTVLHQRFVRPRLQRLPRLRKVLVEIGASFLNHFLGAFIGVVLTMLIFRYFSIFVIFPLIAFSLTFPAVHSLQYARMFYRELRETELQEERLKALAAEAELKALKAQINPHFLFNTLNTIAHLIRTDPARAERMVEKLAEIFRYALFAFEKEAVPLQEELAFIEDYLDLESERFGDRLQVKRSIASDTLAIMVPPLILQPLVENALKHGQGPKGEVELELATSRDEEFLEIVIKDQGPGMPSHVSTRGSQGIGLRNVRERLEKIYGQGYGLEIKPNEPRGTKIVTRIPRGQG
jgi:sensor histidine kinase YesM